MLPELVPFFTKRSPYTQCYEVAERMTTVAAMFSVGESGFGSSVVFAVNEFQFVYAVGWQGTAQVTSGYLLSANRRLTAAQRALILQHAASARLRLHLTRFLAPKERRMKRFPDYTALFEEVLNASDAPKFTAFGLAIGASSRIPEAEKPPQFSGELAKFHKSLERAARKFLDLKCDEGGFWRQLPNRLDRSYTYWRKKTGA